MKQWQLDMWDLHYAILLYAMLSYSTAHISQSNLILPPRSLAPNYHNILRTGRDDLSNDYIYPPPTPDNIVTKNTFAHSEQSRDNYFGPPPPAVM